MTHRSPAIESAAQEAFERTLLASAKLDAPAEGASKLALARFALAAATVTALEPKSSFASPGRTARSVANWLAMGVFVGGAIVAAYVLGTKHDPTRAPSTPRPSAAAVDPRSVSAPLAAGGEHEGRAAALPNGPSKVSPASERLAAARSATQAARRLPPPPASTSASLAEEVARLDAARTALAIGDFKTVSQVLDRYNMDFPHGVLAREADVVAISAFSEKGESAEALRLARRFLVNYPHDLHVARVKQLVSWQGPTGAAE